MLLSLFSLFLSFFGVFQTEMGNGGVFGPAVRVIHMDSECEISPHSSADEPRYAHTAS